MSILSNNWGSQRARVARKSRRPALWRKHDVLIGVFRTQIKQHTAHQQRQQYRVHQDVYHVLLAYVELIQFVLRLQLSERGCDRIVDMVFGNCGRNRLPPGGLGSVTS